MPYPVHLLDKMIANGINQISLCDFIKEDRHHRELVQSDKRLTKDELDQVIFGLEQVQLPPTFFPAEESFIKSATIQYTQYKIPIAYKNRWFTLSFSFFSKPQHHLNGEKVHYLIYQEFLPWDHAIYLKDNGELDKISGDNTV